METTENTSASGELTSTLTDSNDATQILTGDSVPSSSSDANLGSSYSKTIQDDPISSTSDSVSTYNFHDEKEDFFSSDLNIENIRTENINEDVEDIATDLENLLGETSNDYLIPLNKNNDKGVSKSPTLETLDTTNTDENNDNKTAENQEVDSTDKKYIKSDEIESIKDTKNNQIENIQKESTLDSTSCPESNVLDNSLGEGNLDVNQDVSNNKLKNVVLNENINKDIESKVIDVSVNNDNVINDGKDCNVELKSCKEGEEKIHQSKDVGNEKEKGGGEDQVKIEKCSSESRDCLKEGEERSKEVEERSKEGEERSKEGEERPKEVEEISKEVEESLKEVEEISKEVEGSSKEVEESSKEVEECSKDVQESSKKVQKNTKEVQESSKEVQECSNEVQECIKEDKECLKDVQEVKIAQADVNKIETAQNDVEEVEKKSEETQEVLQSEKNEEGNEMEVQESENVLLPEISSECTEIETVQEKDKNDVEVELKPELKEDENDVDNQLKTEEQPPVINPQVNELKENETNQKNESECLEKLKTDQNDKLTDEVKGSDDKKVECEQNMIVSEDVEENAKIEEVVLSESKDVDQVLTSSDEPKEVDEKVKDKKVDFEPSEVPKESKPVQSVEVGSETGQILMESCDEIKEIKNIEDNEVDQSVEMSEIDPVLQQSDVSKEIDDKVEDKNVESDNVVSQDVEQPQNVEEGVETLKIDEVLMKSSDEMKESENIEDVNVEGGVCEVKEKIIEQNVQEKNENVQEKSENVQEKNENVQEKNENVQEKNENFQELNENAQEQNKNVEEQVENVQEQMENVQHTENVQDEIDNVPEQMESVQQQTENVQDDIENVQDEIDTSVQQQIENVQEQTDNVQEKNENVQKQTDNVQEQIENVQQQTENVQEQTDNVQKQTDNVQKQVKNVEVVENIQEKTKNVQEQTENVQEQTERIQEQTDNVQKQVENVQVVETDQEVVENIQEVAENIQEVVENVQEVVENIQEVVENVQEVVENVQNQTENIQEQPEEVQQQTETVQEEAVSIQKMEVEQIENPPKVITETLQSQPVKDVGINKNQKTIKMTISSIIEEAIQEEFDKAEILSSQMNENQNEIVDESLNLVSSIKNIDQPEFKEPSEPVCVEEINKENEVDSDSKLIKSPQTQEETSSKQTLKDLEQVEETECDSTLTQKPDLTQINTENDENIEGKDNITIESILKPESQINETIEQNDPENLVIESSEIYSTEKQEEDDSKTVIVKTDTVITQVTEISLKDDSELKEELTSSITDVSYNIQTETVNEKIKSISVIPDSLDEGNIAALAICEPSNMDYYQIEVDLTPQSDNKSINPIIEYENHLETVHVEERIKYPSADDAEVIATAAALTANQNDEVKIEYEQKIIEENDISSTKNDGNKDNLEILDIEEDNVVAQQIIETPKKIRNKNIIEESQKPSVTSSQTQEIPSQSCSQIQPLIIDVESPIENKDEEVLTPQYSSKMSTKEVLKLTITKHKIDSPKEEDSILKIYDPKDDKKSPKKEVIPKLIIKPVRPQSPQIDDQEQSIPKLLIRNMSPNRPCSPKVKHQKNETSSSSSLLKVTIKPVVKTVKNDEENFTPKITIKPIIKPEEEPKISPRITIKPLIKPDDDVRDDERSHSPRVIIKPIKGDDTKNINEEMVHSPRITIKPIKPPDDEECSPKITIKPLIKPQEEERHEKKEGSPKIKIKPIVKPVEELLEPIDFEEQIKQERIVLKINTKDGSRKREASEEIEKLAKIKLKFSKEGGHAHIVSDQNLKRSLEQSHDSDTKRTKIDTVDLSTLTEKIVVQVKDDSNSVIEDPIDAIPTFQINTQSQQNQNLQTQNVQNQQNVSIPPVVVPPPPRKRGRPRKIPLVVREDFKDAKDEETEVSTPVVEDTGRPKRSCRGPSVCTTLGIKPRKPRGGGAGTRGRGRGRGSRGSRGGNRQQRVSTRSKLLLEEEIVETSVYRRLAVDEIIEIPDDDPKEEEHPPHPLPPTHHHREVIESPPGVDDTGNTESVAGEKISSRGCSDVVLIEEETRMSADIHSSRAHTPAKHVLAVADIDDTQSSVQSTATSESVKVRKGSRLEVHPEQDDIISPDQLAEYYWGGAGPYMIQEQVAQFLGIKSFKRKYPGIQRRPVDMQERDFIRESCLASEAMCDMGLTAVASADILDIMYSDFQPKYEEYCKHQRDRHTKEIINKQKALNLVVSQEKSKHDLTQQAMQSAASWNHSFNRTRKEDRKACIDLQTFTINYPKGRFKVLDKGKVGSYPIALVPGQYTDNYKEYSPNELYNLPLNTMMNQTLSIVRDDDDSPSDGSGSDSDTTSSDSDSSSSDSSDEDCNLCCTSPRKVSANN